MNDQELIKHLERKVRTLENEMENMPLSLIGKVVFINPIEDVSKTAGKVFNTQHICINTTKVINRTPYSNSVMIQFTADNCKLLEGLGIGDKVEIKFSIRGKIYTKDTIKPSPLNLNAEGCITNLNGYEVNVIEKATSSKPDIKVEDGKKPDTIPAGYKWDELKSALVVDDDLPFKKLCD